MDPYYVYPSLSLEHVNYSGTSGHVSDDGGPASDIDAYKESYFTLASDTTKHSHLRPEELGVTASKMFLHSPCQSAPLVFFFHMTTTCSLHFTIVLVSNHYIDRCRCST